MDIFIHGIDKTTFELINSENTLKSYTPEIIESLIASLDRKIPTLFHIQSTTEVEDGDFGRYVYSAEHNDIVLRPTPLVEKVTRGDINDYRDQLDESPVTMDGLAFDADQLSLRKMTDVANFVGDYDTLDWTLADNTVHTFTGSAFKLIVNRVKAGQTKRSYYLHAHAKMLKEKLPEVFVTDLDESLWPMDTTLPTRTLK